MPDTYISIDLDYWNKASHDPWLLDAVFASGKPIAVTLDHHDLLPHLEAQAGLSRVVNVDYHSDFFSTHEPLHCGNWVNYVSWRARGHYLWVLPRMNDYHLRWGYCHVGENPFLDTTRLTGWRSADKQEGYGHEILDGVAAIGICISPGYLDLGSDARAAFRQLMAHVRRAGVSVEMGTNQANIDRYLKRLETEQS